MQSERSRGVQEVLLHAGLVRSFMRASCADLTLGQCLLHEYFKTSIAAAAVVAAPAAGTTGRLSNCSHTQAFFLTLELVV